MSASDIIAGCRTPIGKLLGVLSSVPAPRLGAAAVAEAIRRSGLPADAFDEVIMGNVLAAGIGQMPCAAGGPLWRFARHDRGANDQ